MVQLHVNFDVCSKWLPHVCPQLPLLLAFLNYELWTTKYFTRIIEYRAVQLEFTQQIQIFIFLCLEHAIYWKYKFKYFYLCLKHADFSLYHFIKQCIHRGLIKIAQPTSNLHHFTLRTHPPQSISALFRCRELFNWWKLLHYNFTLFTREILLQCAPLIMSTILSNEKRKCLTFEHYFNT